MANSTDKFSKQPEYYSEEDMLGSPTDSETQSSGTDSETQSSGTPKYYSEEDMLGPQVGGLESAARGFGNLPLLGYEPQVVGKLSSIVHGTDYEKEKAEQQAKNEAAWEQHPYAYGAGTVAGIAPAVLSAFAAPEVSGPAAAVRVGTALEATPSAIKAMLESPNIAGFVSGGLRGLAGEAEGVLPSLGRGAASVLEKPVVQGAIYGSSEGNDIEDKLIGAAEGALGTKAGEFVLKGAAKGIGALAKGLTGTAGKYIAGEPTTGQIYGDLAEQLGVSLPQAVEGGPLSSLAAKTDIGKNIPAASAKHLSEMENKISDFHQDVLPENAGEAVKNSFLDWLKNGSQKVINSFYKDVDPLSKMKDKFQLTNLQDAVQNVKDKEGRLMNVEPSLNVVNKALSNSEGINFQEIRQLRQIISDQIDYNRLYQDKDVDERTLQKLRNAVSADMKSAANYLGGSKAVSAIQTADANASGVFQLRSELAKKLGTGNVSDKSDSSVFSSLVQMARAKTGDYKTLEKIKSVVDQDDWNKFSQGYVKSMIPDQGFTYGSFLKNWNSISPEAKNLIFGNINSSPVRQNFEKISKLGVGVGDKIDKYASKATSQSPWQTGEMLAAAAEMAATGVPLKSTAGILASVGLGKKYAANIAKALPPPTERQKIFQFIKSNPVAKKLSSFISKNFNDPKNAKAVNMAISQLARTSGAAAGIALTPIAIRALMMWAGSKIGPLVNRAEGGRVERAHGGRTGMDHVAKAAALVKMAERAKKMHSNHTEQLLDVPDESIAAALKVANRAI